MIISKEEEMRRMALYRQGLSDTKIAERLGLTGMAICKWRKKRKLPAWRPAYRTTGKIGYPINEALPLEKQAFVLEFLHDLVEYSK